MRNRISSRSTFFILCTVLLLACEDEDAALSPNRIPDLGFDSQDAALPDTPAPVVVPTPDANQSIDVSVDGQSGDSMGLVDASFVEPVVDVPAGCTLASSQHIAPEQAGLPSEGLTLWLRSDQGVYKNPNSTVCAWADHSGSGRALKSQSLAASPLFVAAVGNALPSIRFTGGGKALSVAGVLGIAAQSGRTFIAVQKLVNTQGRSQPIIQGQGGTPGTYISIDTNTFRTKGSLEGVYITNNAYDSSLATSVDWRVHNFLIGPMVVASPILPALRYRINGTLLTLSRAPGGLGNTTFETFSGANATSVGAGVAGSDFVLAEVLVYDHPLSAQDVTKVETALGQRYGINSQLN